MTALRGSGVIALAVLVAACTPGPVSTAPSGVASTPASSPVPEAPLSAWFGPDWFDDTAATAGEPMTEVVLTGGDQVEPGLYRVVEPVRGDGGASGLLFDTSCKYGSYRGAERGIENLVVAKAADGGHPVLRVGDGQTAYSTNCGRWERVSEEQLFDQSAAADTAGDGTWTVGIDLAPGTWRWDGAPVAEDAICVYQVDSSYDAELAETVDLGLPEGPAELTLELGQRLLSEECGSWTLVEG